MNDSHGRDFFLGRGVRARGHAGCSSHEFPVGTTGRAVMPGTFASPGASAGSGRLRTVVLVQRLGVGGLSN